MKTNQIVEVDEVTAESWVKAGLAERYSGEVAPVEGAEVEAAVVEDDTEKAIIPAQPRRKKPRKRGGR